MTRTKQIWNADNHYRELGSKFNTFENGAKWADTHPAWIDANEELPPKVRPIKYKTYKYKDRFKNRACPICGSNHFEYGFGHAEYPEVWNWQSCYNCGCVVGYEDNSPWFDIWDELKKARIRSKKKVLEFVRKFYLPNEKIEKIYK